MYLYQKKLDWVLGGFEFLRADTTVETDPGSGGAVFAVDANGSTLHPYAKMEFGASGTQTPVSAGNPLPVVQTGTPGLPTGAATAAKQDTGNTSLATLAGAVAGTEMQVDVLTSALPTGASTEATLAAASAKLPATLGQKAMAAALAVSIASDQSNIPTTDGGTSFTIDAAQLPATLGQKAMAASLAVVIASDQGNLGISDGGTSLTTDTPQLPAALDGSGNLKVAIMSGAGSGGTSATDDAAFTPGTDSGTPIMGFADETSPDLVNEGDVGVVRMTLARALHVNLRNAAGDELLAGDQYAEDTAHASGDSLTMAGAVRRDTAAVGSGTDGDNSTLNVNSAGRLWTTTAIDTALPAGTNNIGLITDVPGTSGGWAISTLLSAGSTNATSAKGSAGQVGGWYLYNANAAVRYLKLYNKATAPTVGTDVPVMTIPIPPGSAANVEFGKGIAFATGIAFAITTGVATADTGAVAANEIIINLLYK